ncbi:hypothetical protein BH23ACT10_BH23ACT10_04150 [soil metagenome]
MWSTDRELQVDGAHYRLDGVHGGPAPAHDIGIWVGATGPRMLANIGRLAAGWVPSLPYVPPERLGDMHEQIDAAAHDAGRDPATIRRIYNVGGAITDGARGDGPLDGPVDHWVDALARYATGHRMDTFIHSVDLGDETQLRRFAEEVVPGIRAALDA